MDHKIFGNFEVPPKVLLNGLSMKMLIAINGQCKDEKLV